MKLTFLKVGLQKDITKHKQASKESSGEIFLIHIYNRILLRILKNSKNSIIGTSSVIAP